ncbi:sensor histidine kinase [Cohnella sp. WQ 127256]|uniref:cache domain-containing sensor histidine kinase n=1 Tax=Cohnella sp. WQ 127256 TaxID=2938790 RepID=UPI0021198E4F|nr:sensor histidine kinase [Cohnella sp. WQ 127256]
MLKSMSFYYKLLILFIIVGVIPLIIIGSITYGFSKRFFLEQFKQQSYNKLSGISEKFDLLAEEYGGIMNTLSDLPEVRRALLNKDTSQKKDIEQRIHLLLVGKKYKASIYLLSADGSANFATSELPSIYNPVKYRAWGIFRTAHTVEDKLQVYPHTYEMPGGGKVVLSMIQTIHSSSGDLLGYVIVDFTKSLMMELVGANDTPFTMDFVVLDPNAYTVLNSKHPELEGTLERNPDTIGDGQLVQSSTSNRMKLVSIGYSPDTIIRQSMSYLQVLFAIAAFISILICVWFAYILTKNVSKPINELVQSMKRIAMGDLSVRIVSQRNDEFGIVGRGFNSMATQIKDLISSAKDEQRRLRIAEIKALQAQLNPHFIYNTLDLIKWNAKMNNTQDINHIVVHLARLLRGMIHVDDEITTLKGEMTLIDHYLYIQRYRFMDRLFVDIQIDSEIMDVPIPRLLIHPLVENAIIHGFEKKVGNVYLSISGVLHKDEIHFEITDNGIGMKHEVLERIRQGTNQGGIGVSNVHKRIQLYYGHSYGLQIYSEEDKGTRIEFILPYRRPEE